MKHLVPVLALGLLLPVAAPASSFPFDRYEVILTRMPFGEPPPPPAPAPPPAIPPEQSFARAMRLSMLVKEDDGSITVGIFDQQANTGMRLRVGESDNGIEVVSADYEKEEAVLRKGQEVAVITFSTSAPQNTPAATPPVNRPTNRTSRNWGRRGNEPPRDAAPAEPPAPRLTGEELQKHLEEYKMQAIRQGLPPLPIPLTPEQDDQLVREGVLPPQE